MIAIEVDPAKDAVHELAGVGAAERLRQLDRFVDGGLERDTGQIADLEGRDPQKGAFNLRHLVKTPVARRLGQLARNRESEPRRAGVRGRAFGTIKGVEYPLALGDRNAGSAAGQPVKLGRPKLTWMT